MEYYAGAMSFSARLENDTRVHAEERFYRAEDNKPFLGSVAKFSGERVGAIFLPPRLIQANE